MDWSNLQDNICPKCEKSKLKSIDGLRQCEANCGFTIREARFNDLINKLTYEDELITAEIRKHEMDSN